jgi:amidase
MDPILADASGLADSIREGETTAVQAVSDAIARINERDPFINSVIHRRDELAVEQAEQMQGSAASQVDAPFYGVPILLKDALLMQAGQPYHCGMRVLKERQWVATHNSDLTGRISQAGFVPVGRTNVPEWATAYTTEPLAYGPTRNPWDLDHTPGGSSGGSAAAVAAGLVPIAHGNDMGGSIRLPAAYCGLVGLKPTRARTSLAPDFGEYWAMLTHEGVLTRTVRDTALALDAISGMSPGDPYTAPAWSDSLRSQLDLEPRKMRIGVRTRIPWLREEPDGACIDAVNEAASALESLGHEVLLEEVPALDTDIAEAFGRVFTTAVALDQVRWSRVLGQDLDESDLEPRNWALIEAGRQVSGVEYLDAVEQLQQYARQLAMWWHGGFDVLLTPTAPGPAPRLGYMTSNPTPAQTAELGEFCAPFNVTGQPAMSLPGHWNADGLPVGVQLVAAYGREDVLIALAAQLERVRPWAHRWPSLPQGHGQ